MQHKCLEPEPAAESLATEGRDPAREGTPSARKYRGSFHYNGDRILSKYPL